MKPHKMRRLAEAARRWNLPLQGTTHTGGTFTGHVLGADDFGIDLADTWGWETVSYDVIRWLGLVCD